MPVLPSHNNESIDLQSKSSKSIDWFLYEGILAFNGLNLLNDMFSRTSKQLAFIKNFFFLSVQ